MRHAAALEVVPLDDPLEALAAAGADHIHAFAGGEHRDVYLVARLQRIAARLELDLANHARRRHAGLLEVPLGRLVLLVLARLDEAELHGLIAVLVDRLHLRDDTGPRPEH